MPKKICAPDNCNMVQVEGRALTAKADHGMIFKLRAWSFSAERSCILLERDYTISVGEF